MVDGQSGVAPTRGPWAALGDAVLGTGAKQRIRVAQAGLALLLMLVGVTVMQYVAWQGAAPLAPVQLRTAFPPDGLAFAFVAIRSGWSRRFADPSLAVPQMVYAIACGAWAYTLAGPMRGAVFPILMVILMFGMFSSTPRQMRWIALYAVAIFGAAMAAMAKLQPQRYPGDVELGHFLMLAIMLPAVSALAAQLGRLRERLVRQKAELAEALSLISQLATRDDLTGLANRRHMLDLMNKERQRSMRSGAPFCLALVDLDHFKRINDRHGHAAGDDVLRAFAREASATIRASDALARWGGEEFVLMLPDTRAALARQGLERLRQRCASGLTAGAAGERVTVSIGVAEHRAGETVEQTLERADRALYEAKAQGRDRVVVG